MGLRAWAQGRSRWSLHWALQTWCEQHQHWDWPPCQDCVEQQIEVQRRTLEELEAVVANGWGSYPGWKEGGGMRSANYPLGETPAETKAVELMRRLLGDEEVERYRQQGHVFVKGGDSGEIYIVTGSSVQRAKPTVGYCVMPLNRQHYPWADNVLTLAVRIRAAEATVLRIANRDGVVG